MTLKNSINVDNTCSSCLYSEIEELINLLEKTSLPQSIVVLMPDFFVDIIVRYDHSLSSFTNIIKKTEHIPLEVLVMKGGKAVNTAYALSALGVKPRLIVKTSALGLHLLKFFLKEVDLSHVKLTEELSSCISLELWYKKRRVNIALYDTGSLPTFDFEDLNKKDLLLLREADYVFFANWALIKNGTKLVREIFKIAKKNGAKTYLDLDISSRKKKDVKMFIEEVLSKQLVDILSMTNYEAILLASFFDKRIKNKKPSFHLIREAGKIIAERLKGRVDIHGANYVISFTKKKEIFVPTFKISRIMQLIGAGDVWNAGNLYAELCGFNDKKRLLLANAIAAYYISHPTGDCPSINQLIDFLKKARLKRFQLRN